LTKLSTSVMIFVQKIENWETIQN